MIPLCVQVISYKAIQVIVISCNLKLVKEYEYGWGDECEKPIKRSHADNNIDFLSSHLITY